MILKNKKALILTSLLILLPIPVGMVLQKLYPGTMVGAGQILWPVLALLVGQWVCVLATAKDPGNRERNRKPLGMVLWIIPILSNLMSADFFAVMLGAESSPFGWMYGGIGLIFAVVGNYMPKTKMNSTLGIKISTAYSSEENWNATHRFAGKLWFWGGIVMLFGVFLPENVAAVLMFGEITVMVALPIWYSYRFYRREKAEGKDVKPGFGPTSKKHMKASLVALAVVLVFCSVIMFTGDIEYQFREESVLIEASMYSDQIIYYGAIQDVELREGNVPGSRVGGFQSLRLLMGFFRNEEFGTYIRYTYYKPEACVIVTLNNSTLVLSGETAEETRELYQTLLEKTT